ncbi:MAG: hypothetical protein QOK37_151 [Thermoanaerobaculia bacterium]|jgi:hypothetical protein|nr:hypothetical protein [Thermoanaerobaculia bacterium]
MIETSLQHEQPVVTPVRSFGKQARSLAGYTILAALMFISPLRMFLPAALFHCGIRMGRRAAWLVFVLSGSIAALLVAATVKAGNAAFATLLYSDFLGIVLAVGLSSLAVLPLVERGERFGRVLMYAVMIAIAGFAVTELSMRMLTGASPYAAQVAQTHTETAPLVASFVQAGVPAQRLAVFQHWLEICLPAQMVIGVILVFVFSLVMLGRLRAWRNYALQRDPAVAAVYLFRNLSLPEWLLFAFVASGLTPLASGMLQQIGANVLAVVAFLYLLQGLAIFRSFIAATRAGFVGSLLAWMLLGFLALTGISQVLLCMAGLFDSFFDFRHFNRKDHSDESHSH